MCACTTLLKHSGHKKSGNADGRSAARVISMAYRVNLSMSQLDSREVVAILV